jgi:DNA-binding GntR family transcriptional regulator
MIEAIRQRDVARADELAHAHTRQFRDNFIDFMRDNYTTGVALSSVLATR